MTKLLPILFMSILLSGELEVDGNLKVTGTIQASTIDSLLSLIAQLEQRIAQLECQNTGIIPDGYCDCLFHTLDECGVCNGDNTTCQDCAGVPNGDAEQDMCGTCDTDSSNDCVQDCFGEWGGAAVEDVCGICGGDAIYEDECILTDVDGNTYETVEIGSQTWMAENLKTFSYRNGEYIQAIGNDDQWSSTQSGSYCNINNTVEFLEEYGRLYNWFAVNDDRGLCMEGWHVPSDDEWKELEMFLGMSQEQADQWGWRGDEEAVLLKDDILWNGSNIYGFSAVPSGWRRYDGTFIEMGWSALFWTSDMITDGSGLFHGLADNQTGISRSEQEQQAGLSVRCIKD